MTVWRDEKRRDTHAAFVVGGAASPTNVGLASALAELGHDAVVLPPGDSWRELRRGDVLLGRVDVLPTLDGVEACLWDLRRLERRGVRVLNGVGALLAAHDKLATAVRMGRAGIPHPRTMHLDDAVDIPLEPPIVLKPRFGSWGRDVVLCETADDARRVLLRLRKRQWFRRHGVIVQELVEPAGRDLRLIVTRTGVVGAIERRPAPGEWRTNVALGGTRHPIDPPEAARALAVAAADAVEGDLVGVDLLPTPAGDWLVLELNGAVDFTSEYSLPGRHVFRDVAAALAERALPQRLAAAS